MSSFAEHKVDESTPHWMDFYTRYAANISCLQPRAAAVETVEVAESKKVEEEEEEDAVHFEVDLLCFNGLPPSGPLLAPISMKVITEKQSDDEKKERDRVIAAEEVISVVDHDEEDESKKIKYLKGHALVQRMESKQRKNVYFYEIAISLESHFEEIQKLSVHHLYCVYVQCESVGVDWLFNVHWIIQLEITLFHEDRR